mgnify:CR=1 FL=1
MYFLKNIFLRNCPPTLEEGISLVQRCCDELQKRYLVNMPSFRLKVITKDGMKDLPNIVPHAFD